MNHSFNIVTYKSKHEISKKQNPKGFKPIDNDSAEVNTNKLRRLVLIAPFCAMVILFFVTEGATLLHKHILYAILSNIFAYGLLFTVVFYAIALIILSLNKLKTDIKTEMSFYDLGEKIHFSDEGITLISPQDRITHTFLYKEIEQFTLCFKEIDIPYETKIAIFVWHHKGQKYQYTIEAEPVYQVGYLIQLLNSLYSLKIPIQEIDEYGKKMYLLKPEKKPKVIEIAPEIQSLIDEIGEDDKTTFN